MDTHKTLWVTAQGYCDLCVLHKSLWRHHKLTCFLVAWKDESELQGHAIAHTLFTGQESEARFYCREWLYMDVVFSRCDFSMSFLVMKFVRSNFLVFAVV